MVISSTVTDVGLVDPALLFLGTHAQDSLAKISNDVVTRLFTAAAKTRHNTNVHPLIYSSATKNRGKEGSEEGRKRWRLGRGRRKKKKREDKRGKSPYIAIM